MTNTLKYSEIKKPVAIAQKKQSRGFFCSGRDTPFFQPKLTIGAPNDRYEREADAVADKVMRMPENTKKTSFFSPATLSVNSSIQPKCAACEKEEKGKLQRKKGNDSEGTSEAPGIVDEAINSEGEHINKKTRSFMESRMGYDFSDVKIHTGPVAAKSAQAINALAYTSGNHVVFNEGQYTPDTESGKKLLAHELTHVIQQSSGIRRRLIQRTCGPAQIGSPEGCHRPTAAVPESPRYLFDINCDTFAGDNEVDLRASAQTYGDGDTIEIHGLASDEGEVNYNFNLSCARALRAKSIVEEVAAEKGIHLNLILYAHGPIEGEYQPVNRSIAIVRYTHELPPDTPTVPEPAQPENQQPICSLSQFWREALLIDPGFVSDFLSCVCLGGGILDLFDASPHLLAASPFIEWFDCSCNAITTLQHLYNIGADEHGCWDPANVTAGEWSSLATLAALTYADCASLPLGASLGAFLGGLAGGSGGTAAEPGGGTVVGGGGGILAGAALGDFIVDIIAMGFQNYITQGTFYPVNQCRACVRLVNLLGIPVSQDSICGEPGSMPQF